ncbi:MAG: dephospho-CoA kinase [Candidatus Limnocylindrales bacterium]
MTVRIGIGGPIGCGKSTVAGWLADLGATVVDADELARIVTAPGEPAAGAVLARFGPAVAADGGAIDRAALAAIVFADPAALRDLEAIVHPAVRRRIEAAFATAELADAPAVVVEAIRLAEGGLAAMCDEVWSVECSPADQRSRLTGRGMTEEDIERRMAAQGDVSARLRPIATRTVDAGGDPAAVRARVGSVYAEALGRRV